MNDKPRRGTGGNGVSIQDVAREAGVAASTVSRALTMPGRIAEKTRSRVLEAASRLGYTANAAARNLRVGRSKVVLIVLPGPLFTGASQVTNELLSVANSELASRGYTLITASIDPRLGVDPYVLNLAFSGAVDGAILLASSSVPEVGGRSLADSGIPIVAGLFDMSKLGIPSVITDDREVSRQVIEHLLDIGHRHFLYVSGPKKNYNEVERYKGVRQALARRADCQLDYSQGEFIFSSGTAAADRFLSSADRATAVFCCNDDMAIGFMRRLAEHGVRVPTDVSVVGFDGSRVSQYTVPSLSSVQQPINRIAEAVVEAIVSLMERRREIHPRTVVQSSLLVRESIASLRAQR